MGWDSGLRTSRMEKGLRHGQTVRSMTASTRRAINMAQESFIGLTAHATTVRLLTITFMAMATIYGQTSVNTMGSGEKIRCMETDFSPGVMVEPMRGSTPMTRSMARVF